MSIVCKCPEMGIEFPEPIRTSDGIRLEVIRDFQCLEKYAEAWNRLAQEAGSNPMLSYAWMVSHLLTRLNPGDIWFCLLAFNPTSAG